MTNDFLLQRHAAYNTPEQTVFALVKRASGYDATAREQIVRGYDSEVYAVQTRQGQPLIVKIRHHGEVSFAQEAWALERCRAVGVPVPDVLLIDTLEIGEHTHEVMIQRRLPGTPLSDRLATLAPRDLERICAQAGAILSGIHSVQVEGFYWRYSDGHWTFPDWDALMQSHIAGRKDDVPFILQSGFTAAEVKTMLAMMEQYRRDYVATQPVLCHGDFLPGHLFVDDTLNLTGVIDFGEFGGGPPIQDFVTLNSNCPTIDLRWLQTGYSDKTLFDETFDLRLLLHKVGQQMGYLGHYVRQGNHAEIASETEGLRATLREWQARG